MNSNNSTLFAWLLAGAGLLWLPFLTVGLVERVSVLIVQRQVAWARYDVIVLGMVIYSLLEWVAHRNPEGKLCHTIDFLKVFTHELLHMVVSMMFLNRMRAFNAQRETGHVMYQGTGNAFIALAPYFLPLYTILLLVFRIGFSVSAYPVFDIFLGMTYAFHLTTFWQQQGLHQTDITSIGVLPSYILIVVLNLFFWGMMLCVPSRGWTFFGRWIMGNG